MKRGNKQAQKGTKKIPLKEAEEGQRAERQ